MAILALLLIIFSMTATSSGATWCICRPELSDAALQKTLDYACGAGADCTPIIQNGPCYNPNTVKAHCSYAANSYFQRKGQAAGTCDFAGTATTVTTDPSTSTCVFPSSASSAGTTPSTTPPTGTSPSTTPPTGTSPSTTPPSTTPSTTLTPPTGIIGGTGSSLGPSGLTDPNGGLHPKAEMGSLILAFWFSWLLLLRD